MQVASDGCQRGGLRRGVVEAGDEDELVSSYLASKKFACGREGK
jgi:hypothetical protein